MTNDKEFAQLNLAVEQLESESGHSFPGEELIVSTLESIQSAESNPKNGSLVLSSKANEAVTSVANEKVFPLVRYGVGGAVCTAALLLVMLFVTSGSARPTLAKALANVKHVSSFSYVMTYESGTELPLQADCYVKNSLVRTDCNNGTVTFLNTSENTVLYLEEASKTAQRWRHDAPVPIDFMNPSQIFANIVLDDAEFVETVQKDGRTIDVFELTKLPVNLDFFHSKSALGDEFLVWVDRDTQLPMKLSFYHASQDVSWEMFEFQWNRELGLEMFEMTIPEDYEVIEFIPTDAEEHDHQHKLDHDHDHDNHTHENDGHVDAGQHSHEGQ